MVTYGQCNWKAHSLVSSQEKKSTTVHIAHVPHALGFPKPKNTIKTTWLVNVCGYYGQRCYISYRLIVLKCSLKLAQCHVGGGTAVISLDVIFVYLQGLRSIGQGIAIALCA